MFTAQQKEQFDRDGYAIASQLFHPEEVEFYLDYYMKLRHHEKANPDRRFKTDSDNDPLLQYPRLMQMHRWDDVSRGWLLEARINGKASQAAGEDEAGDPPKAGRYFADAIMQPGNLAASE